MELNGVKRCDLVAAVTGSEAELIRDYAPDRTVVVLPNVHQVDKDSMRPFHSRSDLLFIGGFDHEPNVDAVLYLVGEIMPRVTAEEDVRLWVVGSNPPPEITALQSPSCVVTGFVPDADAYFHHAKVFVAPLRFGAGMKGKLGHALALGLPIVTTSVGAEGMDLNHEEHLLVRDEPDAFAAAVVRLYRDRALWERFAHAGQLVVEQRWTPEVMRRRLSELLDDVRARVGTPVAARR